MAGEMPGITDILADLELERNLYSEMLEVSRKALAGLQKGDTDAAAQALAPKNDILNEIDKVEKRLLPVKTSWHEMRKQLPEADAGAVEQAMKLVRTVLAQLIEVENEAQKLLGGRIGEVARKLKTTTGKKNVNDVYGHPKKDDNRFLDERT